MEGVLSSILVKKNPPILQSEAAECGLACIAMVSGYHGYKADLASLRRKFPVSLKGATLQALVKISDQIGFSCRPLRMDLEGLKLLHVPTILHWNMNHFVVLIKSNSHHIVIHDPARGEIKLPYAEVSKHFTGIALEMRPSPSFKEREEILPVRLTDLWSRISGLKRSMFQALILSVFLQIFALTTPLYQQMVVDDAITKQDMEFLSVIAIGFAFMGVMNIAINYLRSQVMLFFSNALSFQMRINLFRHLLRLPTDFFEKRHIGDITSRFGSIQPINNLFTNGIISVVLDGVMAIGTVILAFSYSSKLTFIVLGFLLFSFLLEWITFPILKQKSEEILHLGAKENSSFLETIRAARAIKIFGQETNRESVWQNQAAETLNANIWLSKFNLNVGVFAGLVGLCQSILTLYVGANLVVDGSLTLGMLFAYQAYAGQFTSRIQALIGQIMSFKMLRLHLTRLSDIVHTESEVSLDDESGLVLQHDRRLKGHIQLQEIAFQYGEHEPKILMNLNLEIKAGEMVAIKGRSGGGKTTLLKILLGLLKPQEGKLLLDGEPLSTVGQRAYRSNIGVVMQDDQLLSGTIADNIAFFDPHISMERVEYVAKQASLHDDIVKNPMGYNTLVGDMGTTLSGGQKQRLLIARALYREPSILILDEGTANLDFNSEQAIGKVVRNLPITRIIVAHRPALIELSDRILQMQDGCLIELFNESEKDK